MIKMTKKATIQSFFIATLGVVFGDIGTSPLYTVKECLGSISDTMEPAHVLGLSSLIFWALMIVVSYKYISLILRADNHGEGGILSLMALNLQDETGGRAKVVVILGLIGASMFYGDSIITPAISVLGALEGLKVANPNMHLTVLPLATGILAALFLAQQRGTHSLGKYFGPTALVWFVCIGCLGAVQIFHNPDILYALNPFYAFKFLYHFQLESFVILSSVVLALTGAEALYADIGHFNRESIRSAWFFLVFPSLVLNYFGQGALLLRQPEAIANPFYYMVPSWALYPVITIATLATIIAAQSVISGMFSMTWQAIQLGFFPRMRVVHTSAHHFGQIYVPSINMIMFVLTIISILLFQTTDAMAAAYGLTVTVIMVITTLLTSFHAHRRWGWSLSKIGIIFGLLMILDLSFLGANMLKLVEGGWFPILISVSMLVVMTTWKNGRKVLAQQAENKTVRLGNFLKSLKAGKYHRIPGTAIFLTGAPKTVPHSLVVNLKHNKVAHERIVFLSIVTENIPRIASKERVSVEELAPNVYQITGSYGFKEIPNIANLCKKAIAMGLPIDKEEDVSYYLSRGIPVTHRSYEMAPWREKLFILLSHNAMNATEFFKIPTQQVIEVGIRFYL